MAYRIDVSENFYNIKTPSVIDVVYPLPSFTISGNGWIRASGSVSIKNQNGEIQTFNATDDAFNPNGALLSYTDDIPFLGTIVIKEGVNTITYTIKVTTGVYTTSSEGYYEYKSFTIYGVPNKLPLKPWTNGEVMDRLLDLVEPIRQTQERRFAWQAPEGKEKVFAELAPEYTFTRLNLRECCQTVGGRIHAEPRLKTINGKDTITFDFYGEQEYATIKNHKTNKIKRLSSYKYTTNKGVFDLEQTCTRLDSYMENLVSRVNWNSATIGQPYEGKTGGLTLRTATEYQRAVETDDYYFITQYPIDRPVKFEAKTPSGTWVDITAYIYEKQVYNNLSSYANYSPAKAFALYYEQGQQGIKGFFYKVPNATGGVYDNYSIVNVVQSVSGEKITDYTAMQFRLTYVPIYATRVGHGKQYVNDYLPLPRTINYSQGANQVESRYFGQNIKATAQRLGNIEKSYTFNIRNADNIPKSGRLWDENYYIATVSVEVGIDLLRCTVGLSKHFNRKSQYIGANSYRRVYEVSETMVQERNTVYNDYLIVRDAQSETNEFYNEFALLSGLAFDYATSGLFTVAAVESTANAKENAEITSVQFRTSNKNDTDNSLILLPVIASAFGNAMEFSFECQDNYSAGIRSDVSVLNTNWLFGMATPYGDYYGRGYYFHFTMLSRAQTDAYWDGVLISLSNANDYPLSTDEYPFSVSSMVNTLGSANGYVYRKDSREKLKMTYSVEFVADGDDFILGNALTEGNPLVSYSGKAPHLYVLPFRVNRFADRLSAADLLPENGAYDLGAIGSSNTVIDRTTCFFKHNGASYSGSGLSWCIALPVSTVQDGTVEDEDGNVTPFMREIGGDILIAKNVDISTLSTVGDFEILLVHDLYKDYINKK